MEDKKSETKIDESQAIVRFREMLNSGDFEEARRIERELLLPPHIVKPVVNTVFDLLINDKRYREAIDLGKRYDLPMDRVGDTVYMEFRELIAKSKFEEAIDWGLKNNLSGTDITNAALRWVEYSIKAGDIKTAIYVKEKYSVSKEQVGNIWMNGYNEAFDKMDYFNAALLSREFGMSERKTILTAVKGFKEDLKKGNIDDLEIYEKEFNIFNDVAFGIMGDEEGRALIQVYENFLEKLLSERNIEKILEVVEATKILYKVITHSHLKGLLRFIFNNTSELHGRLLDDDKYEEALNLKKGLSFYEDNVSDEIKKRVYEQAKKYHNKQLQNKKLEMAIKVRKDYNLYGDLSTVESMEAMQREVLIYINQALISGNIEGSVKAAKEYEIPDNEIQTCVKDSLMNLMETYKYEIAMNVLRKFKVDKNDEELFQKANEAFKNAVDQGYHEIAAEFGYRFKLKNPKVKLEAKIVWENCMETENFKKAKEIKLKHNLSKRETNEIAKKHYYKFIESDNLKMAKQIRDDYNVSLGIFAWIIELFKQLFSMFFKKKEHNNGEPASQK